MPGTPPATPIGVLYDSIGALIAKHGRDLPVGFLDEYGVDDNPLVAEMQSVSTRYQVRDADKVGDPTDVPMIVIRFDYEAAAVVAYEPPKHVCGVLPPVKWAGGHKSKSYEPCSSCGEDEGHCFAVNRNTPDAPCWGQVSIAFIDETDEGTPYRHECEGHRDMYAHDFSFENRLDAADVPYKPEPK